MRWGDWEVSWEEVDWLSLQCRFLVGRADFIPECSWIEAEWSVLTAKYEVAPGNRRFLAALGMTSFQGGWVLCSE